MNMVRSAAIALLATATLACSGRGEVSVYGPGPDDDLRDRDDTQETSATVGPSTGSGGGDLQQRCLNWCDASRGCPAPIFEGSDCNTFCQQLGGLAEASGCDGEYRSLLDCVDVLSDVCEAQTSCAGSFSSFSNCLGAAS